MYGLLQTPVLFTVSTKTDDFRVLKEKKRVNHIAAASGHRLICDVYSGIHHHVALE